MADQPEAGGAEVRWDDAPLRVYGIATWSTGFSWPACRIDGPLPFIESIVPRPAGYRMIPGVVSDERARRWRPFRDRAEREYWQRRVGDTADLLTEGPLEPPRAYMPNPTAKTIPWS
jgi:hypothetical protein